MHELSEATLRSLFDPLTPLPLGKDAGAISHESTSGGAAASLHMMQPEEAERENDREEEHFCSDSGVGEDESSGTVELLVKSELSLLLRVLHEVYYQAQLLYLESLHRSAGFKYCAVAVVVKSFILSLPQRERDGLDLKSLRPYLDSILASCLINASACRAYCGQYEKRHRVCVPITAYEAEAEELLRGPLTCYSVTNANPLVLCHAGLKCHISLLGCTRGALVAEEMGCYQQGLSLLDMGWRALLPGLDAETLAGITSASGLLAGDQTDVEMLWETVWSRCKAVIDEQSDNTSATSAAIATAALVCRYPRKQRFSQTFLCGEAAEPLGDNLEGKIEEVARSSAVLEPQEVPPLVEHLHRTSTRLRFKLRRFEG